ncbi:MAG: hypothetical protein RL375_4306 [Pseudomonadota bacterium]|jgi:phage-related protein
MAVFTWSPDWAAQGQFKPRVRSVAFGDGYQQRSADGINTNPGTWALTFGNRADGEAAAIMTFLEARNGLESFDWTPPGGTLARYICPEWAESPTTFGATTITARFVQVFES